MEPVTTTIVAALVAGAAVAAKDAATDAVKSAYQGLKNLIIVRYPEASQATERLSERPDSASRRESLAEDLEAVRATDDIELKELATKLLDALETTKSDPTANALLDFETLRAAKTFKLDDIHALGTILRVKGHANFEGDFEAKGLRQTDGGTSRQKN